MGEQVNVTPEELDRLATTLTSSLSGLSDNAGAAPGEVDAGVSTGPVTEAIATFYKSIARMAADTEHQAGEVSNAGGVYIRSDDQAASQLPPLPLSPNSTTGGR
ncbi:hypothetical protein [Saccharopolyspora sp. NPDC002578]